MYQVIVKSNLDTVPAALQDHFMGHFETPGDALKYARESAFKFARGYVAANGKRPFFGASLLTPGAAHGCYTFRDVDGTARGTWFEVSEY